MLPATENALPAAYLGKQAQLAFVVRDLDATLRYWTETLKVGPFVVIEKSVGDRKVVHRGAETAMDTTLAFAYMGDVQIEIVHPINDEPVPLPGVPRERPGGTASPRLLAGGFRCGLPRISSAPASARSARCTCATEPGTSPTTIRRAFSAPWSSSCR